MLGFVKDLLGIGKAVAGLGKADKDSIQAEAQSRANQAEINRAEINGAPQSRLRLWRSALGWALSICFIWEVMLRPVIETYLPTVALPPSFMKEITSLLLGMLGLGF